MSTVESTKKPIRKRSRGGCHNCKRLKIKCDEQKPTCKSCQKYNVLCDYSLKLSWGGRPSKRGGVVMFDMSGGANTEPQSKRVKVEQNKTELANEGSNGNGFNSDIDRNLDNNFFSSSNGTSVPTTPATPATPATPGTASLSNYQVQNKINNMKTVFHPTPQQRPVSSGSFILEYNVPERKVKRERNVISDSDRITEVDDINQNQFDVSSTIFTEKDMTEEQPIDSLLSNSYQYQNSQNANSQQNLHQLQHNAHSYQNSHQNSHPHPHPHSNPHPHSPLNPNSNSHSITLPDSLLSILQPLTPTPDTPLHDEELALSPPRFIPELSALDSLNNLLEEDTFIQDQQFIDDFIISEHAFANSSNNHETYKNALLQVPARNLSGSSSKTSRALAAYHNHKRFIDSLLNGGSNATTPSTESLVATPSDTGTDDSDVISIPRGLTPLPDILIQVPVYRDLFYHFVDVTADALVPVPRLYNNNPFKIVLPRMALNTPHILSLIIAYSATHRAKVLHQPEPVEMISKLLERTFDGLTKSLENEKEALSDTTLATAIMLSSYSIISSAAEESWKTHLHGAREIVIARGIANSLSGGILSASGGVDNASSKLNSGSRRSSSVYGPQPLRVIHEDASNNEVLSFLIRVFAYIDVIGALSSSSASSVLTNNENASQLWTIPNWNRQQRHYQNNNHNSSAQLGTLMNGDPDIDFLLGIDLNLIPVLSRVSALAKRRRTLELNPHRFTIAETNAEDADLLSEGLELSKVLISCCSSGELRRKERIKQGLVTNQQEHSLLLQLATMNLTFGYAGLIHLYRRVLKLSTDSAPVQELVTMISDLLEENIPIGTSIEACMSFPIFTTACEVIDPKLRDRYRERMNSMQRFGFGQVSRAQQLMEECWARNEPWTGIMDDLGWGLVLA